MNGLYMDFETQQIVDSEGNMCSGYPLDVEYPQETPVGAKCSAECAIGLKAEGSPIKIIYSGYTGSGEEQKATFELEF